MIEELDIPFRQGNFGEEFGMSRATIGEVILNISKTQGRHDDGARMIDEEERNYWRFP